VILNWYFDWDESSVYRTNTVFEPWVEASVLQEVLSMKVGPLGHAHPSVIVARIRECIEYSLERTMIMSQAVEGMTYFETVSLLLWKHSPTCQTPRPSRQIDVEEDCELDLD